MEYIGLDIHKKHINGCVMDKEGTIKIEQKFNTEPKYFEKFLKHIDKEDSIITIEACSCWEFVYDYLTDAGYNVVLTNPCQIQKTKRKTDKLDAKLLADLLRVNMLPTVYAAPRDIRDQRSLTRLKASLTMMRTQVKNKIQAILTRNGIVHDFSDVFGVAGIEYLKSLDLEMRDRYQMDSFLKIYEHFTNEIKNTMNLIEDFEIHDPNIKILRSHPGIDYYLALLINGELGNLKRFKSFEKVTSFVGLNPSISQSGDRCYMGHITKQGNKRLRWGLIQAAHVAVMHDSKYAKFFHTVCKRRNKNIAYVAVARKILKTIYYMLKHNSYYIPRLSERKAS
jgi:transposase